MVASLSVGYFTFMGPNSKETSLLKANAADLQTVIDKKRQADQRVAKAKKMVDDKAAEWRTIVATNTPPEALKLGGIDMKVNPQQLIVDSKVYRDSVQAEVNQQLKVGGVKVVGGVNVPTIQDSETAESLLAGFYNYPAVPFPVVIFDFGTVTVTGTYDQILANVRGYKSMKRYLAVADGLRISGTSPYMTGTYNLTVVGFIRAKEVAPEAKAIIDGGSANGANGAPGGFGGQGGPGAPSGGQGRKRGGAASSG